jgi:uncharacterized membrane protein YvbJ
LKELPEAYCPGCGFNNMEAVNFCTKCGIALSKNTIPVQNSYQQSTAPGVENMAYTAKLKQEFSLCRLNKKLRMYR